jgi:hypothetical protein
MSDTNTYPPPFADPAFAREMGRKGGLASAKARQGNGKTSTSTNSARWKPTKTPRDGAG